MEALTSLELAHSKLLQQVEQGTEAEIDALVAEFTSHAKSVQLFLLETSKGNNDTNSSLQREIDELKSEHLKKAETVSKCKEQLAQWQSQLADNIAKSDKVLDGN